MNLKDYEKREFLDKQLTELRIELKSKKVKSEALQLEVLHDQLIYDTLETEFLRLDGNYNADV